MAWVSSMRLFLRKIRWDYWASIQAEEEGAQNPFPADPLADLAPKDNRLSVYLIEPNDDRQLERVLAALAATRQSLNLIDFTLFDESLLKDLHLAYVQKPGSTFDPVVNGLHWEIVHLTAEDLVAMARALSVLDPDRREEPEVGNLISRGLCAGHIDQTKLQSALIDRLLKRRYLDLSSVSAEN